MGIELFLVLVVALWVLFNGHKALLHLSKESGWDLLSNVYSCLKEEHGVNEGRCIVFNGVIFTNVYYLAQTNGLYLEVRKGIGVFGKSGARAVSIPWEDIRIGRSKRLCYKKLLRITVATSPNVYIDIPKEYIPKNRNVV